MDARRLIVVAAAIALAVALLPGLGSARDQAQALRLAREDFSPRTAPRIEPLLVRASEHTGSTEPELDRAKVLLFLRRPGDAARLLERVVRSEPENADAWGLLAQASPRRSAAALARARALSPPVPEPQR